MPSLTNRVMSQRGNSAEMKKKSTGNSGRRERQNHLQSAETFNITGGEDRLGEIKIASTSSEEGLSKSHLN